ncbi:hypothetical protein FA13DRAFT_1809809 [Coprinellus micaceus]|uniref:Uncharacterized protein n=1 Tax=Coprinellus micaceus TaxID=71717 RepID=A0A4Y7TUK9_COPMI|nr:hypothetical protein FA13DRAFT_1809809 [Coprinellus micaceus]
MSVILSLLTGSSMASSTPSSSSSSSSSSRRRRKYSSMDSIYSIVFGLALRSIVGLASRQDWKVSAPIVGLWEGVITLHFMKMMPSSFDPYVSWGVRMLIDYLITESVSRMVLVVIWTCLGMALADVAPSIWFDVGLHRPWRRVRRDMYTIYKMTPKVLPRTRVVRFSSSRHSIIDTPMTFPEIDISERTTVISDTNPPDSPVPERSSSRRRVAKSSGYSTSASVSEAGSATPVTRRSASTAAPTPILRTRRAVVYHEPASDTDDSRSYASNDVDRDNLSSGRSSSSTSLPASTQATPHRVDWDLESSIESAPEIDVEELATAAAQVAQTKKDEGEESTPRARPLYLPPTPSDSAARWDLSVADKDILVPPPTAFLQQIPDDNQDYDRVAPAPVAASVLSKVTEETGAKAPSPPPKTEDNLPEQYRKSSRTPMSTNSLGLETPEETPMVEQGPSAANVAAARVGGLQKDWASTPRSEFKPVEAVPAGPSSAIPQPPAFTANLSHLILDTSAPSPSSTVTATPNANGYATAISPAPSTDEDDMYLDEATSNSLREQFERDMAAQREQAAHDYAKLLQERHKVEEAERARIEEERRALEEERQRYEAEQARLADEMRRQREEKERMDEERRKQDEERQRLEEERARLQEEKRVQEEERVKLEEERKRLAQEEEARVRVLVEEEARARAATEEEERRRVQEEEERRIAEEAEQLAQAVAREAAEEEARRVAAEAEAARLAAAEEAARLVAEEEATRRAAEEEEAKRLAEEAELARIAAEQEAKWAAEEAEAKRLAEEAAAEAARLKVEEEEAARRAAEEAEAQRIAEEVEAQRLAEEAAAEAGRLAVEAKRLAEEAEAKRLAEEEAERTRLAEEEAERTRLAEEEAERVRLAEEAQRLATEAEAARLAAEEAEAKKLAEEDAKRARLADEEAERTRLAEEEAERTRLAEEEAERLRLAAEAEAESLRLTEAKRLAEEAEARRLAEEEAERTRLAEEAEKARLAEEAAEAEKIRLAEEEAEKMRLAQEEEARQLAEAEALKALVDADEEKKRKKEERKAKKAKKEEEKKRKAEEAEAEAKLKADEEAAAAEQQRLAEEAAAVAEQQRLADEAAEQQRLAEEAEQQKLAEEAEQQRLAQEAAEAARIKEQEEEAERQRQQAEAELAAAAAAEEAQRVEVEQLKQQQEAAAREAEALAVAALEPQTDETPTSAAEPGTPTPITVQIATPTPQNAALDPEQGDADADGEEEGGDFDDGGSAIGSVITVATAYTEVGVDIEKRLLKSILRRAQKIELQDQMNVLKANPETDPAVLARTDKVLGKYQKKIQKLYDDSTEMATYWHRAEDSYTLKVMPIPEALDRTREALLWHLTPDAKSFKFMLTLPAGKGKAVQRLKESVLTMLRDDLNIEPIPDPNNGKILTVEITPSEFEEWAIDFHQRSARND